MLTQSQIILHIPKPFNGGLSNSETNTPEILRASQPSGIFMDIRRILVHKWPKKMFIYVYCAPFKRKSSMYRSSLSKMVDYFKLVLNRQVTNHLETLSLSLFLVA